MLQIVSTKSIVPKGKEGDDKKGEWSSDSVVDLSGSMTRQVELAFSINASQTPNSNLRFDTI
jgi:hypothetical protein